MYRKTKYILTKVFGDTVRIKILEILLESSMEEEIKWLNISEIAKIAGISTSSSKRIVDELIDENIAEKKPIQTHARNPEKEIHLNLDNKIVNELIFFYRKLRGLI